MVPAGIAVAAVAAIAFEVSYVLQALEARSAPKDSLPAKGLAALARRRRWLAGLALAVVGGALQVLALRLAPLTVVQPALALGIVALVAAGGRVLGEPASRTDVLAALALSGGIVLLGIAGSRLGTGAPSRAGTAIAVVALGIPVVCAMVLRGAPPWLLLAAAGAGDVLAAIAAKRFADAWGSAPLLVSVGWVLLGAGGVAGALASEMSALRTWPATRVGPFVVACQTAVPVLLAPVVAGERWGPETPLVLVGLAIVVAAASRLAISARLLEPRDEADHDVGGARKVAP